MNVSPTQTRKSDLYDLANFAINNSLNGLRVNQKYVDQAINALTRRIQELRATEQLLVQWVRRDVRITDIQEKYNADHFKKINSTQAYAYTDSGTPDPHEYTVYTSNKLATMQGIPELLREQEKVRANINYLQQKLEELKNRKKEIEAKLSHKWVNQFNLEQDKISKRMTSELFILYLIHKSYRDNTVNEKGERAFTQDSKIINYLEKLHSKFITFAEKNPWVVSGKIELDLEDPGSDQNSDIFFEYIPKLRETGKNKNLYREVEKYSQEMRRNLNDPTISKNVSSKLERNDEPGESDSQAKATKSTSRFRKFYGTVVNIYSKYNLTNFFDASEKYFDRFVRRLHGDRPFCSKPPSEADKARDKAIEKEKEDEEKAIKEQKKLLRKEGLIK